MKQAIIISLSPDRRSGIVHSTETMPADQAIRTVKDLIAKGEPLDPKFPIVQAIDISSVLRGFSFNVNPKAEETKPEETEEAKAKAEAKAKSK